MDSCGVLIVGAGPAGTSCAWGLRQAGLDIVILDKNTFPRDKICGGWITPEVLDELQLDPREYARGRVFQPIVGFRTSRIGGPEICSDYGRPISYGIRRCEFDDYLLHRCRARTIQNTPLKSLERSGGYWIVNGGIQARIVVGAGGHFCPVARFLGADARKESAVAAQEVEFEMDASQRARCSIRADIPELYFCPDMRGYGWCFRKENFLNIGLGRLDPRGLPGHVSKFLEFLRRSRKIGFDLPAHLPGHAYLLFSGAKRQIVCDGMLLVGDAAGLAYSQSGEGIRPAIESGLLAAEAIVAARGAYTRENFAVYRARLEARFGSSGNDWAAAMGRRLPPHLISVLGRILLASGWFARHVILDRWFLHRGEPALQMSVRPALNNLESVIAARP
ncbi:MAG TPA: NAD(P)/FAD-dependent oxidoreductase [Candidatus Sulfotelmatobacter sp.]|nr:NAD(P)/FAD-dependent oxidoreductase [Candidatus Sulfotelmatobacter sp.]